MRWDLIEDKINLYLQTKWSKFTNFIFEIYNKLVNFSLTKSKELTSIDFKKVASDQRDNLYKIAHYIQDQSKVIPKKISHLFLH